jgi:hypothetical protein
LSAPEFPQLSALAAQDVGPILLKLPHPAAGIEFFSDRLI